MDNDDRRLALQRGFIAALALLLTAVFLWMVRGYIGSLFLAATLAIFLMPVQNMLTRLFFGRQHPAAAIVLILAVFLIVLPLTGIVILITQQAVEVAQTVIPWVQDQIRAFRAEGIAGLPDWLPLRDALEPYQDEIARRAGQFAGNLGSFLMGGLTRAPGGALSLMLNSVIFLFALFYLLTGGREMMRRALDLLPMRPRDRQMLADRTLSTIRATVKGTFVIAVVQGSLTGAALGVAGVPGFVFWGAVAGVLSIVPAIGPPLIWAPAALWLVMSGDYVAGIGVFIFGAVVIMNIDNILRPRLVGQDAKMTDLMVLLSTLGGLTMFGAVGLVIGPVIAALFTSAWFIYAQSFETLLSSQDENTAVKQDGDKD